MHAVDEGIMSMMFVMSHLCKQRSFIIRKTLFGTQRRDKIFERITRRIWNRSTR